MRTDTFKVSISFKTAVEKGCVPEGHPEGKDVPIGSVTVDQYELTDWDSIPENKRSTILANANRQHAQDEMNSFRASFKDSDSKASLKREREQLLKLLVGGDTTVIPRIQELTTAIGS